MEIKLATSNNNDKKYTEQLKNREKLRRMFLLTEPAFKKVKQELDNEKYLSVLEKEMKKIMMNRQLPMYKKWLQYNNAFIRFADFKKLLAESRHHKDMVGVRQISKLEKQLKAIQEHVDNEKKITQRIEEFRKKRHEQFENQIENENDKSLSIIEPISNEKNDDDDEKSVKSLEKDTSDRIFTNSFDNTEQIYETPNASDEIFREFDNEKLEGKTIYDRFVKLSTNIARKVWRDAKPQSAIFNITYRDKKGDEHVASVDAIRTRMIDDGNVILTEDADGKRNYYYDIEEDDLSKLRNYLLTEHRKIDKEIEKDLEENPPKQIPIRRYKVKDKDENTAWISFRNQAVSVPKAILSETLKYINDNHLKKSDLEVKKHIESMKKNYSFDENRRHANRTLFDPNKTSTIVNVDDGNQTLLKPMINMKAKVSSTPKVRKSTKTLKTIATSDAGASTSADTSLLKRKSLKQSTMKNFAKVMKSPPKQQQQQSGKGMKIIKWKKI